MPISNKQLLLNTYGNKCAICGYDGPALEFHHKNALLKKINISEKFNKNVENDYDLLSELVDGEIILICSRCHSEHHKYNMHKEAIENIASLSYEDLLDYE